MKKNIPPTLKTSTQLELAEHEFLLSFNNDSDALAFSEWWTNEGEQIFMNFLSQYEESN